MSVQYKNLLCQFLIHSKNFRLVMRREKYLPHKSTSTVMTGYISRYFIYTVNFIHEKLCPQRKDWRITVFAISFLLHKFL